MKLSYISGGCECESSMKDSRLEEAWLPEEGLAQHKNSGKSNVRAVNVGRESIGCQNVRSRIDFLYCVQLQPFTPR